MIEIKTNEVLDILDKLQFFQGQRAWRELWLDKPPVVQEQDLDNFNRDIEKIRSYIQSKNTLLQEIVERLEGYMVDIRNTNQSFNGSGAFHTAIKIVKEVGGMND